MERPLHIPVSKKWKGLTVYCNKCKRNVSEICKETGKSIQRCPYGNKHVFKVYIHVPGTDNERKTKILDTRDVNEAIKYTIGFEKEVKSGSQPEVKRYTEPKEVENSDNVRHLLINAIARYVAWLRNENVPTHLKEERSDDHIKDIERKMERLVIALMEKGYDMSSFRVNQINDKTVGDVYDYLESETN